jgi:hypothetical protein
MFYFVWANKQRDFVVVLIWNYLYIFFNSIFNLNMSKKAKKESTLFDQEKKTALLFSFKCLNQFKCLIFIIGKVAQFPLLSNLSWSQAKSCYGHKERKRRFAIAFFKKSLFYLWLRFIPFLVSSVLLVISYFDPMSFWSKNTVIFVFVLVFLL